MSTNRRPGRLRRVVAWVFLALGAILLLAGGVAVWSRNQVLDTDRYVRTVKPLADDPAIQEQIATSVSTRVSGAIDIDQFVSQVLPGRVGAALAPALQESLEQFLYDQTLEFTQSDQFPAVWEQINRAAHTQVVAVLTGRTENDAVAVQNGTVSLDLTVVVQNVIERLNAAWHHHPGPGSGHPARHLARALRHLGRLDGPGRCRPAPASGLGAAARRPGLSGGRRAADAEPPEGPDPRRRGHDPVDGGAARGDRRRTSALPRRAPAARRPGRGPVVLRHRLPLPPPGRPGHHRDRPPARADRLARGTRRCRALGAQPLLAGRRPGGRVHGSAVSRFVNRYRTPFRLLVVGLGCLALVARDTPPGRTVLGLTVAVVIGLLLVEFLAGPRRPAEPADEAQAEPPPVVEAAPSEQALPPPPGGRA